MYFRKWTSDSWCTEGNTTIILKVSTQVHTTCQQWYDTYTLQSIPGDSLQFVVPSLVKVEPEKLQDRIPKFTPWISSTAQDHWEDFLKFNLANLSRSPGCDSSFCWPVLVLQAASDRKCKLHQLKRIVIQMKVKYLRRCLTKREFQSRYVLICNYDLVTL